MIPDPKQHLVSQFCMAHSRDQQTYRPPYIGNNRPHFMPHRCGIISLKQAKKLTKVNAFRDLAPCYRQQYGTTTIVTSLQLQYTHNCMLYIPTAKNCLIFLQLRWNSTAVTTKTILSTLVNWFSEESNKCTQREWIILEKNMERNLTAGNSLVTISTA